MATCFVSFLDTDGVRHSVEIEAESFYEAASLAIRTFKKLDYAPGIASQLEVEVRTSIKHTLSVRKVQDWLRGGAKNPKEKLLKERLRELLDETSCR